MADTKRDPDESYEDDEHTYHIYRDEDGDHIQKGKKGGRGGYAGRADSVDDDDDDDD